jgi:monofunctional biosynthetic peptidoglycan transglycosylase
LSVFETNVKKKKKRLLFLILSAILISGISACVLFASRGIAKLQKENPGKTSFMRYREKEWERKGKKYRISQVWVPLSRVSPYLIKAVLIAEDDKFWKHEGFDYDAMQKAMEKDIKEKKFKLGGSTVSQQLAKNLYLSPAKNPFRKIAEAVITWRMEKILSKKRILELYLNVIEWGEGIFGVEAASRHYFGKAAADLSAEEAARLAAVLPNPRKYNPTGNQRYVVNRSTLIYSIMVRRGIVIPEYQEVSRENSPSSEAGNDPTTVPIEKLRPAE